MHITRRIQAVKLRHIGGLLVIFLLGMAAMRQAAWYVSQVSGGAAILDLNFGNNTAHINHTLAALGEAGRSLFACLFANRYLLCSHLCGVLCLYFGVFSPTPPAAAEAELGSVGKFASRSGCCLRLVGEYSFCVHAEPISGTCEPSTGG